MPEHDEAADSLSDEQLQEWFAAEVVDSDAFGAMTGKMSASGLDSADWNGYRQRFDTSLSDGLDRLGRLAEFPVELAAGKVNPDTDWAATFAQLSIEAKRQFHEGWERNRDGVGQAAPQWEYADPGPEQKVAGAILEQRSRDYEKHRETRRLNSPEVKAAERKELALRRIAAGIALFAALAAGTYACTRGGGDDGEVAVVPAGDPGPELVDEPDEPTEPEVSEPDGGGGDEPAELPNGWDAVDDNAGSLDSAGGTEADRQASDIDRFRTWIGSYVFEMSVVGDGESMAAAPTTKWYNPRFIVNNDPATNLFDDDTGFAVDVKWSQGGEPSANVTDVERAVIPDAAVEIVWTDPSTLQVTVEIPGPQVTVARARVELSVRTEDADGNTVATYGDDAFWVAES